MSFFVMQLPGLAIGPRYMMIDEIFYSRSNTFLALITFFLYYKKVWVDSRRKVIRIQCRILWFFVLRKEILFSQIRRIDYGFSDIETNRNSLFEATDSIDIFTVSVVLHDLQKIKLWSFIGEGSGDAGNILGDDWIDFEGSQQGESLSFVDVLLYLTEKKLV